VVFYHLGFHVNSGVLCFLDVYYSLLIDTTHDILMIYY
jgi:hypothetical protein